MNSNLLYISWKVVSSQIIWYHVCVVCVHAWMNRRHCLRECENRLAPKLLIWCFNKTIGIWVLNRFLQIQITSLKKLNMPHISNIEYKISTNICARVWLCFCKKHLQCISFDTFNSFPHSANPNIIHAVCSHFGASRFLHSRKQCLLFIQAWTHTTQKWYQMIWDKTLFHKVYTNLLFIEDFKNNYQFSRCKLFFDSHGIHLSAYSTCNFTKTGQNFL